MGTGRARAQKSRSRSGCTRGGRPDLEAARAALAGCRESGCAGDARRLLEESGGRLLDAALFEEVTDAIEVAARGAYPLSPGLELLRARCLLAMERWAEARSRLVALADRRASESTSLISSAFSDGPELPEISVWLAVAENGCGDTGGALRRLDSLVEVPSCRLLALKARADIHYSSGRWELARRDFDDCAREGCRQKSPHSAASLAGLANLHFRQGDLAAADALLASRSARLDPERERYAVSATLINRSTVACAAGRLDEAAALCREGADMRLECGWGEGAAVALANLIQIEALRDREEQALGTLSELEELGGKVRPELRAAAHKGIALLYSGRGRHVEAVAAASRARQLASAAGDLLEEAESFLALGRALLGTGDFAEARKTASQGLQAARKLGAAIASSDGLALQAEIELAAGDPARALELGREAWRLATSCGHVLGVAAADLIQGMALTSTGAASEASERLERAFAEANRAGAGALRTRALRELAWHSLGVGDWARVLRLCATRPAGGAAAAGLKPLAVRAGVIGGRDQASAISAGQAQRGTGPGDSGALPSPELVEGSRGDGGEDGPDAILAATWRHLARGASEGARRILDTLPLCGLTGEQRSEERLLRARLALLEERPDEARNLLLPCLQEVSSGPAGTAALHALEIVAAGSADASSARRAAEARSSRPHDSAAWVRALGFLSGGAEGHCYLYAGVGAPSLLRERSEGDGWHVEADLAVDLEERRCRIRGGPWIDFREKPRPLALLCLLVREKGRYLSKPAIHEHVWGSQYSEERDSNNVYNLVWRLRKVLRAAGLAETAIRTLSERCEYGLDPDLTCRLLLRGA